MSNLYRGPSKNDSYQVLIHLDKQFQKRRFFLQFLFLIVAFWKSSPLKPLYQMNRNLVGSIYGRSSMEITHFIPIIRNKNCLWQSFLLTNRDKMSTLYRGPSIHAFYQISVHLGKRFQRRFVSDWPISKNLRPWNCLANWTKTW
jgi:hypothetical protein